MTDAINLKRDAASVKEAPYQPAFTGVQIYVGKDEDNTDLYYSAGNSTGPVLEIENPWGTQAMANAILSTISGYQYRPMSADGALLDAAAEVGDGVSANGVYSVIARRDTKFGSLLVSDIAAPSDGELGHEYKYEVKQNRQTQREIAQANSSLIVELDEIKGQVTDDQGNYTVVTIKSDGLYVGGASATLDGSNITSGTIGTTQIAGGAITTSKIDAKAITAAKIDSGAVTTAKLDAGAVTTSKLDSEAVTTAKLLLTGMLTVYDSDGKTAYASLGYGTGNDGSTTTYGAKLAASGGSNYVIVTNSGARMTAGGNSLYVVSDGGHCNGNLYVTGNVYDNYGSDARIKEDIDDDMSKYMDVLMHLRPVSFRYVPEWSSSDQRWTGFIAQEVDEAMEECGVEAGSWSATNVDGEGIHRIHYPSLISVLTACVQNLAKEVAELKEQING